MGWWLNHNWLGSLFFPQSLMVVSFPGKHCSLGRRLPSNSAGKAVIWVSCDQVIIPWWRKLNNVSLFLDLSNIKSTSQVQEYNPTDEAIPSTSMLNVDIVLDNPTFSFPICWYKRGIFLNFCPYRNLVWWVMKKILVLVGFKPTKTWICYFVIIFDNSYFSLILFKTQGTVQEYVDQMFGAILNTQDVPLGIKYIFDFFDGQARRYDVMDGDVLHKWKSNT